jgi:MtN3 and saliva related transmembrane protein
MIEAIGSIAAVLTTFCWIPQVVQVVRHHRTENLSLPTYLAMAIGIVLWLGYGVAIGNLPLIVSDTVSLVFIGTILGYKLRFG